MTLSLIELRQTGPATWDVILGEGDHSLNISDCVESLRFTVDARNPLPQVVLNLTAYPKFCSHADVVVDDLTAEALKMLGWTPPANAPVECTDQLEFNHNPIAVPAPDWKDRHDA